MAEEVTSVKNEETGMSPERARALEEIIQLKQKGLQQIPVSKMLPEQ